MHQCRRLKPAMPLVDVRIRLVNYQGCGEVHHLLGDVGVMVQRNNDGKFRWENSAQPP